MNGIQLDLFTFAAMQIQEKSAEAKSAVLQNFQICFAQVLILNFCQQST